MSPWLRLLLSLLAGLGSAIVAAIALAIVDLYLTGHGYPSPRAPLVDWPGIHLSLADMIFLATAALAAAITWRITATKS